MSMELCLGFCLLASILINFWQLAGIQKIRGVLRTGLRKAEADRTDRVRLPYNQVAELMGWKAEFKRYTNRKTGEEEVMKTSVYPLKEG